MADSDQPRHEGPDRRYLQRRRVIAAATAWFDATYQEGASVGIDEQDDGSIRFVMRQPPDRVTTTETGDTDTNG